MASVNIVVLAGNVTRDIEPREVGQSTVCDIGLAVNESWTDKSGEKKERVTFVDCVAWGKTAELSARYLRKGSPVLIEGTLQLDEWTKDGEKRSKLRVRANRVQFLGGGEKRAAGAAQSSPALPVAGNPDDDIPFAPEVGP